MDNKNQIIQMIITLLILITTINVYSMNYNKKRHKETAAKRKEAAAKLRDETDKAIELTAKITQCKEDEAARHGIQIASAISGVAYILDQFMANETTKKFHRAAQYNQTVSLCLFILPLHNQSSIHNRWGSVLTNNIAKMGFYFGINYVLEQEPIKKIISKYIPQSKQELCKNVAAVTMGGTGILLFEKMKKKLQ
jgi:hypothetical protein